MRMRVSSLVSVVLLATAIAAGQNPSSMVSGRSAQSSINERVRNSDGERLRWEAAQTWSAPAVPREIQTEDHIIHIDPANQVPLRIPKLRRQWLCPSAEAAMPDTTANVDRPRDDHGSAYSVTQQQGVKR